MKYLILFLLPAVAFAQAGVKFENQSIYMTKSGDWTLDTAKQFTDTISLSGATSTFTSARFPLGQGNISVEWKPVNSTKANFVAYLVLDRSNSGINWFPVDSTLSNRDTVRILYTFPMGSKFANWGRLRWRATTGNSGSMVTGVVRGTTK